MSKITQCHAISYAKFDIKRTRNYQNSMDTMTWQTGKHGMVLVGCVLNI